MCVYGRVWSNQTDRKNNSNKPDQHHTHSINHHHRGMNVCQREKQLDGVMDERKSENEGKGEAWVEGGMKMGGKKRS